MKKVLITQLRDRTATIEGFREAAWQLANVLAIESSAFFPKKSIFVDTPLTKHVAGEAIKQDCVIVPILRSGLTLLNPFLQFYPYANVGFIGLRRDEATALPELYYVNLPSITKDTYVILLDPMIATGGSASRAIGLLKESQAMEKNILLASFIASPEGIDRLKKDYPDMHLLVAQVDKGLDEKKYICPGLGDFGDRYFGTHKEDMHIQSGAILT